MAGILKKVRIAARNEDTNLRNSPVQNQNKKINFYIFSRLAWQAWLSTTTPTTTWALFTERFCEPSRKCRKTQPTENTPNKSSTIGWRQCRMWVLIRRKISSRTISPSLYFFSTKTWKLSRTQLAMVKLRSWSCKPKRNSFWPVKCWAGRRGNLSSSKHQQLNGNGHQQKESRSLEVRHGLFISWCFQNCMNKANVEKESKKLLRGSILTTFNLFLIESLSLCLFSGER